MYRAYHQMQPEDLNKNIIILENDMMQHSCILFTSKVIFSVVPSAEDEHRYNPAHETNIKQHDDDTLIFSQLPKRHSSQMYETCPWLGEMNRRGQGESPSTAS